MGQLQFAPALLVIGKLQPVQLLVCSFSGQTVDRLSRPILGNDRQVVDRLNIKPNLVGRTLTLGDIYIRVKVADEDVQITIPIQIAQRYGDT